MLTKLQAKVWVYCLRFWIETGRPPSLTEIAVEFNHKSKNASYKLVRALVRKGFLEKEESGLIIIPSRYRKNVQSILSNYDSVLNASS